MSNGMMMVRVATETSSDYHRRNNNSTTTINNSSTTTSTTSTTTTTIDPTTLAISIIPLILSTNPNDNHQIQRSTSKPSEESPSIDLPTLAASLSTLPPTVLETINNLTQQLKRSKEQLALSNVKSSIEGVGSEGVVEESREKWLENQKINHLKKSIGSLTNLNSTLQLRQLSTLDTLSTLQQLHRSSSQSLSYERDGVRAVNKVLKLKIFKLEKELNDRRSIMESVLERVETVERIDWSVLDHGRLELYNPIHKQGNLGSSDQDQDLCSFHSKVQPINSTNVTTTMLEGISSNSSSKRSLDMVAELTEELENIRREIKLELREKNQEIERLRSSLTVREVEIDRLMGRLSHFMGIEGFYIHRNHTLDDTHLDLDLNLTPRAKSKREDASINQESLPTMTRVGVWSELRRKEGGYGIDCRELEREIQELENILNEDYGYEVPTKFEDSHQAEDRSGSTGSSDSCNSGGEVDLRVKYKKIIKERDRLRSQLQRPLSSHEEENLIKTLRRQLSQLKSENSRVNELLKSSEARVQELERRLAGQEVEFEGLAQRVQEKLKEQRNKILEAKTRIEELESEREMNHEKLDLRTDSDSKKSDAEGDSQSENNSGDHK